LENQAPHLTRVLGRADLTFFLIAALVNLNSVPVVAGMGPGALVFWLAGFLLFFLPQGVAVLELSSRYPQEGGIYNWNKTAFGDFHGFVSGWCYWTNNLFYVPTLLLYIVGFGTFIGGEATARLGESPWFMAGSSFVLLWIITGLNILGLDVGKWIQNIGALGTFVTTVVIVGIGILAYRAHGMANPVSVMSVTPALTDWRTFSLLSVVCLNYVGLELGSVLGDEVKDPRRTIPRAALVAGLSTVILYVLVTFALQATIPASEIGVIDGILQGVKKAAVQIDLAWIVTPIAMLMILNAAGNTSAWLAGSARIPFVIGIDRYLPKALGALHPRFCTPYVSLIVQGFASSLFIVLSAIGTSVHDMYMILLQTTVILQLIPYLYMFAALVRIRRHPGRFEAAGAFFRGSWVCYTAGVTGFVVTAAGIFFAFVPSKTVTDVGNFEFKVILGALSFLIPAVILFRWNARKARIRSVVPAQVEVVPD
jgi:amino acid transporter